MAQKLALKEKSGNFELWAQGETRAFVMVASGEVGEPHRVSVELLSASGLNATHTARNLFDKLVMAYAIALR
jgi:hypothetical protein